MYDEECGNGVSIGKIILLAVILVPLIYFTAFGLPAWGWLAQWFNSMCYIDLIITVITILAVAGMTIWFILGDYERVGGLFLIFIFLIIFGTAVHGIVVIPSSGSFVKDNYIEYIDDPIDVVMSRIVPLKTAFAYAISELQIPTHTIYEGESYIYYNCTIPIYNWIIEPEGVFNELTKNSLGVILVQGEYPPKVMFIHKELVWSLHRARLGPLFWTLYYDLKLLRIHEEPLTEDNIEVVVNNTVYILIPYKTWDKTLFAYIPRLSGYAVVHEDGRIDFVPAYKLMENRITREIFTGYMIPIVPEVIAREWIDLFRWSPGFWEVTLYHQTFEIRDIGKNPQPYLVFDKQGHLWWLFTVEPSGETYAVKYLIYVDAESLKPRILIYKPPKPWIGASKVEEYIKKAHPIFDWNEFQIEEPIPLVINGTLYWKVTIITKDGRGLVAIDLVNAETGEVYSLPVEKKITVNDFYRFIEREVKAGETATVEEKLGIHDRIEKLKERIKEIEETLEKLYKELEALEELVSLNETR